MEINNLRKLAILSVKQAQLPRKAAMAQRISSTPASPPWRVCDKMAKP